VSLRLIIGLSAVGVVFRKANVAVRCCEFDVYRSSEEGCVTESTYESLVQSLDPSAPICIMVHGSFVEWESALRDAYNTYFWLRNAAPNRPLNVILFYLAER